VNSTTNNTSCLVAAVNRGHSDVVRALVSAGAGINTRLNDGDFALLLACFGGYIDTVNLLLDNGADIETRCSYGRTPLWSAASQGHIGVVELLLARGADVNSTTNDNTSCLLAAMCGGHTDVVRAFISAGADFNTQRDDVDGALVVACYRGYSDIVNSLLDKGVDIETRYNDCCTPLCIAASQGHTGVVELLLVGGADVNSTTNNTSCLVAAVNRGHSDVVRALVSAGAGINTQSNKGDSALGIACYKGYIDIVNFLLGNGVDIERRNNDGYTSLLLAAGQGHINVVELLLARGADVNSTTNDNTSCLLAAVCGGHTDVVRALVSAGADVNTQDNNGVSALAYACGMGKIDIANLLLENGGDIETRNMDGATPLWLAAASGQTEVIEALVTCGADIDALDYRRRPPFYAAVENKQKEAILLLLQHNADTEWFLSYVMHSDPSRSSVKEIAKMYNKVIDKKQLSNYLCSSTLDTEAFARECIKNKRLENVVNQLKRIILKYLVPFSYRISLNSVLTCLQCRMNDDNDDDDDQYLVLADWFYAPSLVNSLTDAASYIGFPHSDNDFTSMDVFVDSGCNMTMHYRHTVNKAVRLSCENGANVDAENVHGLRPIYCAMRTRLVELVEVLIQHGANVDAADVFGNRPLHEAVCQGLKFVQLLVKHGAKLNVQNTDGKTPLHIAIERQQCDVIMFLLSQDADVGLTDVWRNTPLHYVTSELSEMLRLSGVGEYFAKYLIKKHQHLLIRNIVGVSALDHIAAHANPVTNVVIYCRQEGLLVKTAYTDCQGNTPLHHAVGVYGKLKMFKLNHNVAKIVDFLVKLGVSLKAQNNEGLTPLHVASGEQAIKACLQYADGHSLTATNKRGRNYLHLLFQLRSDEEVEMAFKICDSLAVTSALCKEDDLNRTPLHYACMRTPSVICDKFTKDVVLKLGGEQLDKRDRFGRTALHYAAVSGNKKLVALLKENKADDTITDVFGKKPMEYAILQDIFDRNLAPLRLTASSSFVARNFRSITSCVGQYVADTLQSLSPLAEGIGKIIRDLRIGFDSNSYVRNLYLRCKFNYADDVCSIKVSKKESLYEDLPAKEKIETIQSCVRKAMEYLAAEIQAQDSRFACEIVRVGSAEEETKIGCCDEFDYNFVLTNLSKGCEIGYSPESPPGFVLLKASAPEYDEDLFNSNGTLNTRIVKFKFDALVKQVLSSFGFCAVTGFEFIDPIPDVISLAGNVSMKLHMCIELALTQPVNGYHLPHRVSVDLSPALQINNWWPDDARRKDLCQTGECLIVFTQPQNKYPWIGWTEPHGFISFARAESRLLRERSLVVKAAYMVVKRMSKYFCHYEFFSSHVIKTALLWCLDEDGFSNCSSPGDNDEIKGDELLSLVQNILRRLLRFAAQDYYPSYFIPKCHQPIWIEEKHLKQYHMRLYRHGLTYKDLFSLNEQQSQDQLLQDIKSMFVFSHVMYWTVLSDNDELTLFVPSTINPLAEISYDYDVTQQRN